MGDPIIDGIVDGLGDTVHVMMAMQQYQMQLVRLYAPYDRYQRIYDELIFLRDEAFEKGYDLEALELIIENSRLAMNRAFNEFVEASKKLKEPFRPDLKS